jgi:hypothetical protein
MFNLSHLAYKSLRANEAFRPQARVTIQLDKGHHSPIIHIASAVLLKDLHIGGICWILREQSISNIKTSIHPYPQLFTCPDTMTQEGSSKCLDANNTIVGSKTQYPSNIRLLQIILDSAYPKITKKKQTKNMTLTRRGADFFKLCKMILLPFVTFKSRRRRRADSILKTRIRCESPTISSLDSSKIKSTQ